MDVIINDSVKGIYDELFHKHPHIYSIVKSRASAKGMEGEDIYKWLSSLQGDEWQALLQEIEIVSGKSLIKITKDSVKQCLG